MPPSSVPYTTEVPFDCRTKPSVAAERTVAVPDPLPTRIAPVAMLLRPRPPDVTASGVESDRELAVMLTASVEFAVSVVYI